MLFAVLAAIPALFFVLGMLRDRRRLSNAVWLGLTLSSLLLWLIFGSTGRLSVAVGWATLVAGLLIALVLPFALVLNGLVMWRREGGSVANLLSLFAGLAMIACGVVFVWAAGRSSTWAHAVAGVFVVVAGYLAFLFVSLLLYSIIYGSTGRRTGFAAIVVLGAGLNGEKVPPLLASRLDRAAEVFRKEDGKPLVVVSGGQGLDEDVSEAAAMRRYLERERGVPAEAILLEDKATTTDENLRYSAELLAERGVTGPLVAVTNNFHVFRTAVLARRLRLRMVIIGSGTASYFLPSAFLREFAALLVRNPVAHLTTCGALVALFLVLTLS